MRKHLIILVLIPLAALLAFAGCESSVPTPTTTSSTASTASTSSTTSTTRLPIQDHKNDLEVSVFTDKGSYTTSESVAFSLKVRNKTAAAIHTYFPTTYRFDFYVYKAGAYIWCSECGKGHLSLPTNFDIGAGSTETVVSAKVWNQVTNTGEAVGAGSYSVTGYLSDPSDGMSSAESFTIVP